MRNKIIIGVAAGIIVLGGLIWIARPNGQGNKVVSASGSGSLTLEETKYDFGSISMADGKVKHQFKIKNMSVAPVTIGKMYTSCMCTTASLIMGDRKFGPVGMPGHGAIPSLNKTVNPNDEVSVEVIFDPAAHGPSGVGKIQRVVTLENNTGKPVELSFAALVTP